MEDKYEKRSRKASLLNVDKTLVIDYKNPQLLKSFLTDRGKIVPARISGMTARQQRQITRAIKRARMLALIPFTVN
ncbi:MAG TPA: 30S ribosomal protein S18 [Nannocystaceae bacterium]|nr:30S ribosomal protein S18 [Nannocystaceae bacterium]